MSRRLAPVARDLERPAAVVLNWHEELEQGVPTR
jgi:hypothetical protein